MPELSRFFGIIIIMFFEVGEQHHIAHFHAYYGEHQAVFSFDPIAGAFPQKQRRLVEAWAELHKEELKKDWELLQSGKKPLPIKPLN